MQIFFEPLITFPCIASDTKSGDAMVRKNGKIVVFQI